MGMTPDISPSNPSPAGPMPADPNRGISDAPAEATPETADQLAELIRWAASEERALEVVGVGTKRGIGRPVDAPVRLSLHAMAGIVDYEPEELVLTVRAGTTMAEIDAALAARHQMLAFEPGDWSALLQEGDEAVPDGDVRGGSDPPERPSAGAAVATRSGSNAGGTVGGVIACNLSGPRRIKSGAARDHLLGFHAVGGRGEVFKSGGRVVKNVTGFDLSKLIAGSYGTLAVMTEVSVRTLPAPEETRTILLAGCGEDAGVRAMIAAMHTAQDVCGAAHLPPDVAVRSAVAPVAAARQSITALRVEGPGPSVKVRASALRAALKTFGDVEDLDTAPSLALWREIRDASYFTEGGGDVSGRQLWRVSVPPADGARVVAEILFEIEGQAFYDWSGGLIWLALRATPDAAHQVVRTAVAGTGGHATLIRAAAAVRGSVPVFQPQPSALAALTARIKRGFDPQAVLNPGRMYAGV